MLEELSPTHMVQAVACQDRQAVPSLLTSSLPRPASPARPLFSLQTPPRLPPEIHPSVSSLAQAMSLTLLSCPHPPGESNGCKGVKGKGVGEVTTRVHPTTHHIKSEQEGEGGRVFCSKRDRSESSVLFSSLQPFYVHGGSSKAPKGGRRSAKWGWRANPHVQASRQAKVNCDMFAVWWQ